MSLPPSPPDKAALRRELQARRSAIADADRARWNAAIGELLERWLALHPAKTLGVFWPMRGEPDLRPVYDRLAASGVRLALPVVVGKNKPLRFAAWSPGDVLVQDRFGVSVPAEPQFIAMPDALLIPCVGFNARRFRLGYGGGFYDRTLAQTPKPTAIGIAYACQEVDFDIDPYDIALDVILTETARP